MVLPIASVASANNSLIDESTTTVTAPIGENEPVIIDLGLTGNDDLFALNPLLAPVKWKDSSSFLNSSIITPMSTDGQNLNWDFYDVSSLVWSTALPNHRYGSISAKLGIAEVSADLERVKISTIEGPVWVPINDMESISGVIRL